MYLKRTSILNFRKLYYQSNAKEDLLNNKLKDHATYSFASTSGELNISKRTTLIVGQNNTGKTTLAYFLDSVSNRTSCRYSDINNIYLNEVCINIVKKRMKNEPIELDDLL